MKEYETAQRRLLLDFLRAHADRQYSIEEIARALCPDNRISVSSVYRNVSKLAAEGAVRRFAPEGGRRFLYQFLDRGSCGKHLHLKCRCCGRLIHMDGEVSRALLETVFTSDRFQVDREKTVLYGNCDRCARNRGEGRP